MMKVCRPNTVALSVSGCEQNCVHCKGLFLESMSTTLDFKADSYLVSGGCTKEGVVPIKVALLKNLKEQGKKINVHPGLVNEKSAEIIGKYADVVSFDFVTDNKIIKEKYNLDKTEQDYVNSYLNLKKYCRVVPHIMIGYGNEKRSLDTLNNLGVQEICIVILSSHPKLENDEPSIDEIESVLRYARPLFKNIRLGCMRPLNRKSEIDPIAVKYVDMIVNPHNSVKFSSFTEKNDCCCL